MRAYDIPIKATNKTDAAFNSINKNVSQVKNNLLSAKGAFAGFIGVAAVGQLTNYAKESLEFADSIAKTADKLGVSTDALQEYRFAAERSGVGQQALDVGIQRFTRRLGEAAEGTGVLSKVLEQQNIQVRDSAGNLRNTEDVLRDYANAIQGAETDQEKLLLAFKAFDTEGAALVNLLRDGAVGLDEFRKTARDAGVVMDEELIRKAEIANDKWDTLSTTISVKFKSAMVFMVDQITGSKSETTKLNEELLKLNESLLRIQNQGDSFFSSVFGDAEKTQEDIDKVNAKIIEVSSKIAALQKAEQSKNKPLMATALGLTDEQIQQIIIKDEMVFALQQENQKKIIDEEERQRLAANERQRDNVLAHLRQGEEDLRRDASRRLEIEKNFNRQKQAAVASTFGVLSTLMSARSKKLFQIGKTAAVASALINTYQAVTKTMAETPYPYNIPLAAAQSVAGLVQVQNIRAQSFSGGGGGSVVGGANASAGAGLPTNNAFNPPFNPFQNNNNENQNANGATINIYNAEGFSDESISNLAEQLADYIENTDTILIRNQTRNALEIQQQ